MAGTDSLAFEVASPDTATPRRRASSRPSRAGIVSIGVVWMGVWWSILGALLAPLLPGRGLTVLVAAAITAAPLLLFASGGLGAYPSAAVRLWVLRPFWYLQLGLPLIAAGGLLGLMAGAPFGHAVPAGRWTLLLLATGYAVAAGVGYLGSRRLQTRELDVHLPGLSTGLEGMRIAQVSDLHVGPHTSRRYLARVVAAIESARPDLIAITGDQVDDYARDVVPFARAFGALSAPLGVFAIAGNHDVYAGWPEVRSGLEETGFRVLVNEAVEIERGGDRFWLAGTGDPAAIGRPRDRGGEAAPNVVRTLARVPEGAFTLALAHNPILWPRLAERGVQLTLSGHTHHGQLSIPALGWSLASPFLEHAMGSHRQGESLLYINPGTNYWGLPFRIGALPEVTVLTLRRTGGREAEIAPARRSPSLLRLTVPAT